MSIQVNFTVAQVKALYAAELVRCTAAPTEKQERFSAFIVEVQNELAKAKSINDSKQVAYFSEKLEKLQVELDAPQKTPAQNALDATRVEVHAALQLQNPAPQGDPGDDDEDVHFLQKKHGKQLWVETDKLVQQAGLMGGAS